jgi:hypothetical protein
VSGTNTPVVATRFTRILMNTLESIRVDNGYQTDLGLSVHRGFYVHVIKARQAAFPAVALHPGIEAIQSVHGTGRKAIMQYTVPLVIATELSLDEVAYDQLEACSYDIRRAVMLNREALSQLGQTDSLELGGAEPDLSRDSRFALAAMTIGISLVETYEL